MEIQKMKLRKRTVLISIDCPDPVVKKVIHKAISASLDELKNQTEIRTVLRFCPLSKKTHLRSTILDLDLLI